MREYDRDNLVVATAWAVYQLMAQQCGVPECDGRYSPEAFKLAQGTLRSYLCAVGCPPDARPDARPAPIGEDAGSSPAGRTS